MAKVSVLSRCAEGRFTGENLTHDTKVLLEIKLGDYYLLAKILCKNIQLIYNLKMGETFKKELIRDIRTTRTILEKSETNQLK